MTTDTCHCELRDRQWEPLKGTCRTCSRPYRTATPTDTDREASNEQYGRAWAKMTGQRPTSRKDGPYEAWIGDTGWWIELDNFPRAITLLLSDCRFETEAEAYAALGKAVRAVHAAVPPLPTPAPDDHWHCENGCEKAVAVQRDGKLVCAKCSGAWVPCTPEVCPEMVPDDRERQAAAKAVRDMIDNGIENGSITPKTGVHLREAIERLAGAAWQAERDAARIAELEDALRSLLARDIQINRNLGMSLEAAKTGAVLRAEALLGGTVPPAERYRATIATLTAERDRLWEAAEEFRDNILNCRHLLAEELEDKPEIVNAILSMFDSTVGAALAERGAKPKLPAEPAQEGR